MFDQSQRRSKTKTRVKLRLKEQGLVEGFLFCTQGQRLLDLLNDERGFLPFETIDGEMILVAKDSLASAHICDGAEKDQPIREITDPHEVLGIEPGVSVDVIKTVYHERVRQYHPDRLTAMGLPKDLVAAATEQMARINAAYARLTEDV